MLLVYGVTPDLLYGNDINRNGFEDPIEGTTDGVFFTGWASCLTVYSREQNISNEFIPRVYVNDTSLQNLYTNLQPVVSSELSSYIVIYRLYGAANAATPQTTTTTTTTNTKGGKNGTQTTTTKTTTNWTPGTDASGIIGSLSLGTATGKTQIKSLYALIGTSVDVPSTTANTPPTRYPCPLNAVTGGGDTTDLLAALDQCTVNQNMEIQGRININTASPAVITCLQGVVPTLTTQNITDIINNQPQYLTNSGGVNSQYATTAWLITAANLTAAQMQQLDQYITTTTEGLQLQRPRLFRCRRSDRALRSGGRCELLVPRRHSSGATTDSPPA